MIPYPFAVNDHQDHNAAFMENIVGAGKKIKQKEISKEKLGELVTHFCCEERRSVMKENIDQYMEGRKGERIDALLL